MIHIILGRQGGGKTILMVALAYMEYKKGKTIYSNIKLNFPHNPINVIDIVECKINNGVFLWDEIHRILSSRNWQTPLSRDICDGFMSMLRKKKIELYGTTQLLRKLDIRVRDERDYTYDCNKYAYIKDEWVLWIKPDEDLPTDTPIMIQVDVYDMHLLNLGKPMNECKISYNFLANEYFNLYDTNEIVNIEGVDEYNERKKQNNKVKSNIVKNEQKQ